MNENISNSGSQTPTRVSSMSAPSSGTTTEIKKALTKNKSIISDLGSPLLLEQKGIPVSTSIKKADDLLKENKLDEAEKFYKEALYNANINRVNDSQLGHYQDLISCFMKLADLYAIRAKVTDEKAANYHKNLGDYSLKAVMFYNAALIINTKYIPSKKQAGIRAAITKQIKEVEAWFIAKAVGKAVVAEDWREDEMHYTEWSKVRELAENGVKQVDKLEIKTAEDQKEFCHRAELIHGVHLEITAGLKSFLTRMLENAIKRLTPPPCDYAVISFGSLAKQSATPYSDIEFGILLQEGKDTSENISYFRNLSYLLAMGVTNLGQTSIPFDLLKQSSDGLGINLDDILTPGFQFDLGGKTPIGRKDRAYELIQTPKEMAKYLSDAYFKVDKLLPVEVASFDYLAGDKALVEQYATVVKSFFGAQISAERYQHQDRALKILSEGCEELQCDLEKYAVRLDGDDGKPYHVKQEIYRLPDRLIDGLALYFGIFDGSLVQKIDKLSEKNVINKEGVQNLKIIAAISCEIRLRIYLSKNGQSDVLPILQLGASTEHDNANTKKFLEYLELSKFEPALFRFYYTALPLYDAIDSFCSEVGYRRVEKDRNALSKDVFYNSNPWIQGRIYIRLLEYSQALKVLGPYKNNLKKAVVTALEEQRVDDGWKLFDLSTLLTTLGNLYFKLGRLDEQSECLQEKAELTSKGLQVIKLKEGCPPEWADKIRAITMSNQAVGFNNMAASLAYKRQFSEAQRNYEKACELYREIKDNILLAQTKTNMGATYVQESEICWRQNNIKDMQIARAKASASFSEALIIYAEMKQRGKLNMQDYAVCLINKATLDSICERHDAAISEFEQAYNFLVRYYGEVHPRVADTLSALAYSYGQVRNPKWRATFIKAIGLYQKLKDARSAAQGNFVSCLNNFGDILIAEGDYLEAIKQLEAAKQLSLKEWDEDGDKDKPDRVTNNLLRALVLAGNSHIMKGDDDTAIKFYEKASLLYEPYCDTKSSAGAASPGVLRSSLFRHLALSAIKNKKQREADEYCYAIKEIFPKNIDLIKQIEEARGIIQMVERDSLDKILPLETDTIAMALEARSLDYVQRLQQVVGIIPSGAPIVQHGKKSSGSHWVSFSTFWLKQLSDKAIDELSGELKIDRSIFNTARKS